MIGCVSLNTEKSYVYSVRFFVHTLRHSFAMHLTQAGTNIRTVQGLLEKSDVNTTMIDTHVHKVVARGPTSPLDALPTV